MFFLPFGSFAVGLNVRKFSVFFVFRPRQHPHKLSSKKGILEGGIYGVYKECQSESSEIEFRDIGILFVKKENIHDSLENRRECLIDPTNGMCLFLLK